MAGCLVGWLAGWLAGWLVGRSVCWFAGWLVGLFVCSLVGWLVAGLVCWLAHSSSMGLPRLLRRRNNWSTEPVGWASQALPGRNRGLVGEGPEVLPTTMPAERAPTRRRGQCGYRTHASHRRLSVARVGPSAPVFFVWLSCCQAPSGPDIFDRSLLFACRAPREREPTLSKIALSRSPRG